MMENFDPYWIALTIVVFGGVMAIIVPYLGKLYDEGIAFKATYFIPLCLTVFVAAVGLIPDPVPELVPQVVTSLFLAGYGIQAGLNFATTRVMKM